MLWLGLLLVSLCVVAIGRMATCAHAPIARLTRQLRRLMWLSIGAKVALCVQAHAQGAPLAALMLAISAVLTLGEFGLIFRWLYPIERAQRNLTATRREYLFTRLGLVWDALAPIATFALGALLLVYLFSGQYAAAGVWGAPVAISIGLGALLSGLSLSRRALPLPVHAAPLAAHLLEEAQRLGREAGVQVREILVLDGTRMRHANAFALSGGRIAITDYLLASLTEQETLAVIAHEVAHLAQRRRLLRLWLLTLSAGVGIAAALAPLGERLPNWATLLWLGLLTVGMTVPVLRLRQRHEREADDFAVSQYGAAPLKNALCKIAAIHLRETDRCSDAVHPALQQRLRRIERHESFSP
ncbi:MAG: M48 family metalloprotease [Fimbriimonadales bacterium]|nr:M48 family metalloprotease [Fimbriimonadales bacterium]